MVSRLLLTDWKWSCVWSSARRLELTSALDLTLASAAKGNTLVTPVVVQNGSGGVRRGVWTAAKSQQLRGQRRSVLSFSSYG